MLEWPYNGICFDVENNQFWMREWGEKPDNLEEALYIAKRYVFRAPILIPIFSHRYIPSEPEMAGNPVYSVYQTDIIFYGYDIPSYLNNEFNVPLPGWQQKSPKYIRFWGDLVS